MNYFSRILLLCFVGMSAQAQTFKMRSPNGNQQLVFAIDESGAPTYSLQFKNKPVVTQSAMGFTLKGVCGG
jgi:Glycosyl-hydrolase 97 N-terminal